MATTTKASQSVKDNVAAKAASVSHDHKAASVSHDHKAAASTSHAAAGHTDAKKDQPSKVPTALQLKEDDLQKLLVAEVHIGTVAVQPEMERYIYKRRVDGVNVIHLGKTWEKLVLAARMIVTVETPSDVVIVSCAKTSFAQRACFKFAHYVGATALVGRYTPGTFTNQVQQKFIEPRLLIVTDPKLDHQPLKESSYSNVPTVALAAPDSPTKYVDCAIPCNNKGKNSIGLMIYLLAREVLYLRKQLKRGTAWDVMPDLFIHRAPQEEKQQTEEARGEDREDESTNAPAEGKAHSHETLHSGEATWEGAAGERDSNFGFASGQGQGSDWHATSAAVGSGWNQGNK